MATENILIEFTTDTTGLESAEDRLEKLGTIDKQAASIFKQTNAELQKRGKVLGDTSGAIAKLTAENNKLKKTIEDLDKKFKSFSQDFIEGFQEGILVELKKAGISVEDFMRKLKEGGDSGTKSSESLRSKLRQLTEEMARLKAAGADNTEQYKKLAKEAGHLKDAMSDVQQEIKGVGSDTRVFDGLISAAQGVAGGFAIAQGAAALFGDESKELQETLLRVNAAMAILQGLQQVQNVLQKESAASLLLNTIATKAQTAAQVAFNFVVGQSTGLLRVFRIALAATGVGLLVLGLYELVTALNSSKDSMQGLNDQLELNRELVEADRKAIQDLAEEQETRAKAAGAKESELIRIRGKSLVDQIKVLKSVNAELTQQRDTADQTSDSYNALNQAISENEEAIKKLNQEALIKSIELTAQLTEEQKKAREEAKKAAEEAAKAARAAKGKILEDQLAALERQKLTVEKGGQLELDLEKKIVAQKALIDLNAEELTQNQIKLIKERSLQDQIDMQVKFNKDSAQSVLEGLISRNAAELEQLNISNEEKLRLTIENIITQSQIEIDAAEGNSSKIKEITANRNADIRAAKLKDIQDELADSIRAEASKTSAIQRELNREINNEKLSLDQRIALIDELLQYQLSAGDKKINALNEELRQGLISQKDYNLQYDELIDEQVKIIEDAEARKRDEAKKTADDQQRANEQMIQNTVNTAQAGIQLLDALYSLQSERENNKITEQRKKLEDLKAAGAITEKEAIARAKKIDAEERKIKQQQAQRDKNIAVFNALIGIPVAYLRGLKDGGLPLAIIYGALAAAQAVIVASRPLPKFRTGKKNNYEGFGEVGEAGAELIEKDGKMFVADKPTVVWLGKKDKVYTPAETKTMMKQMPHNDKHLMSVSHSTNNLIAIDYEKFGDEVAKKIPQTILNITEQGMSKMVKRGNSFEEYLAERRKW